MGQLQRVNYDQLAAGYDRRFAAGGLHGVTEALRSLARATLARRALEVGCGTGYWLHNLRPIVPLCHGLDLSRGMLHQAAARDGTLALSQGHAGRLPFGAGAFDLVYCVNAIHHFEDPQGFIVEARRLLHPGGALAVIGIDPRHHRDRWYIYDYFPGTYERDLARFPPWDTVVDWMATAGFVSVGCRPVELVTDPKEGRAVLDDPFFQKQGCSQLALLSDQAYADGRRRVEAAIESAEAAGETLTFTTIIQQDMVAGWVAGTPAAGVPR